MQLASSLLLHALHFSGNIQTTPSFLMLPVIYILVTWFFMISQCSDGMLVNSDYLTYYTSEMSRIQPRVFWGCSFGSCRFLRIEKGTV